MKEKSPKIYAKFHTAVLCVIFLDCILLSRIVHKSRLNADGKIFLVCTPVRRVKWETTVIQQFVGWKMIQVWEQVCKANSESRLGSWTGLQSK